MGIQALLSEFTASDGVRIALSVRRVDPGRPVLALLHSLGMDGSFWDAVADRVGDRCSIITLDARGHGRSDLGSGELTCARIAQDLQEALDHLDIPRAVVAGASMGGCVALEFAVSCPKKTAGLALIDTTAWYGPTAAVDWEERAQKAAANGLGSLTGFQVTRWFSDTFRQREPQQVHHWVEVFLRNRMDGYQASCRMLGAFDARSRLSSIQAPTRVVVGEEDYAAPVAMAQALHEGIAGSSLVVLEGFRHLTPLETPDRIAAELLDLCARAYP